MLASLVNSLVAGSGSFLFFLAVLLVYPKGMGAGDVKLAGLVGLLAGFPGVLVALWLSVAGGGLVAIALLVLRWKNRKDSIPFGPFIAAGTIAALLAGDDAVAWYLDFASGLGGPLS